MRFSLTLGLFASLLVAAVSGEPLASPSAANVPAGAFSIENPYVEFVVGSDARSLRFIAKLTGQDYCGEGGRAAIARVKKAGRLYDASSARWAVRGCHWPSAIRACGPCSR